MGEAMTDDILTAKGAAEYLKVGVRTVRYLARKGAMPGKKSEREWRFSRTELLQWVEEESWLR